MDKEQLFSLRHKNQAQTSSKTDWQDNWQTKEGLHTVLVVCGTPCHKIDGYKECQMQTSGAEGQCFSPRLSSSFTLDRFWEFIVVLHFGASTTLHLLWALVTFSLLRRPPGWTVQSGRSVLTSSLGTNTCSMTPRESFVASPNYPMRGLKVRALKRGCLEPAGQTDRYESIATREQQMGLRWLSRRLEAFGPEVVGIFHREETQEASQF